VNKLLPKLQGKQSGTSTIAVKSSSIRRILYAQESNVRQGETCVLLVLQCRLGMRMWGEHLENCENNAARFGGTRDERIEDCEY
jgi:hypothetical protein